MLFKDFPQWMSFFPPKAWVRPGNHHFSLCPFVTMLGGQTLSPLFLMRTLTVEPQLGTSAFKSQLQGPQAPPSPSRLPTSAL